MRKYLILTLMLFLLTAYGFVQADQIRWFTNYNQAVQTAQQQNKPLFLFFTGSDWCGWCKTMRKEILDSPEFINSAGSDFVFVDIDFPMNTQLPQDLSQQNAMLKKKFGITGYPTVIILDSNQNYLGEGGYRPGGGKAYASFIKQMKKSSS